MQKRTKFLCTAAIVAALYVVLTWIANLLGLASGAIQVRVSEALCILPVFTAAAIPGLSVVCLIANLLTGCAPLDILFGPIATLIGALGAYALRKHPWLVPIPTILSNAVIVPFVLQYAYADASAYWFLFLTVGAGEVISVYVLGMPLYFALRKHATLFH